MTDTQIKSSKRELRIFGLMMGGMIVLLFGVVIPWLQDAKFPLWPWTVGGIFWLLAALAPAALLPVFKGWMKFAGFLSWINTRLILGVVFFLVILPIALVFRIAGRDSLQRRLDSSANSYRVPSRMEPRNNLERPF